ncbi:GcrA family cell cycle regulator [Bradyrhizobium elkanii]|uniref:GcrA family cell cycle regulator n=1 Tax=Bradyrhizobium elkanii TaxID=29448 RepID=UPI0004141CA7|nr:GcrA family cell cycle regulator [Bradyrhizobium elkanii]
MVNPATSTWDSEAVSVLQRMWGAGNSASVIAAAMHRSRNAVIGKVVRMKLQRANGWPVTMKARTAFQTRTKALSSRTEPARPVSYLKARDFHCHAVLDQRGADGLRMRCGARHLKGASWCQAHYLAYFNHSRSP